MSRFEKIVVIGAGIMGAGIAAQIANAGIKVGLLDIVPNGADDRDVIAKSAIARLGRTNPPALMHPHHVRLITPGNIEDSDALIGDADLIIEAVVEKIEVKQSLYEKIDPLRKEGSIVSSNTSTIPLEKLIAGQSKRFCRDFMITHFFNPPRHMRLLELVSGGETDPKAAKAVAEFCDINLGKSVVICHDRPGFIANRLGVYWLLTGLHEAMRLGLSIEEADAIISKPFGIPKTGIFGLMDMVGLDLLPDVSHSLESLLPSGDPFHTVKQTPDLVRNMIEDGYTGRKGKGGFYRMNKTAGKRIKEAVDLSSGDYAPVIKPQIELLETAGKDLSLLLSDKSKYGEFARCVMGATLSYAARLVGDATDRLDRIDEAMCMGYNWQIGPFAMMDQIGAGHLIDMICPLAQPVPPLLEAARANPFYRVDNKQRQALGSNGRYEELNRPEGVVLLEDIKLGSEPVLQNGSACLWDLGDGITCFEFDTKMNTIDLGVFDLLEQAVSLVQDKYKAIILYNEASVFSVGVNLTKAYDAILSENWSDIDALVIRGQEVMAHLKYADIPVIGAPSGLALGGGCEFLLHCDHIQAHSETYMGLVEVGVGVVPGWGGCKEMMGRFGQDTQLPNGPIPAVMKAFELISTATVSQSAADAQAKGYMRASDGITMNRNRLLADAKKAALRLAENYQKPQPYEYELPGPSGKTLMNALGANVHISGKATQYDLVVCDALADILSGGDHDVITQTTETDILALERVAFKRLIQKDGTRDRIKHMLETGKPLRN